MTDARIHADDTVSLSATLPRDLSNDTVELIVGAEPQTTITATVTDASAGVVKVPLETASIPTGTYEITFRVTDSNGLVEHLPPESDLLRVYE